MSSGNAVVLDESCADLQGAVAAFAAVHVFRRSTGFRCAAAVAADELRRFLSAHGILGRAIYVAPSFAGFTALLVADKDPGALAGILLVDPSHPRQGEDALRILADAPPSPEIERLTAFLAGFGPAWEQSCQDVEKILDLGSIPLHVLVGGRFDLSDLLPAEIKTRLLQSRHSRLSDYARLSTQGSFEIVGTAGHDLCRQAPEAVLAALARMRDRLMR